MSSEESQKRPSASPLRRRSLSTLEMALDLRDHPDKKPLSCSLSRLFDATVQILTLIDPCLSIARRYARSAFPCSSGSSPTRTPPDGRT